jgi:hypothetical protein
LLRIRFVSHCFFLMRLCRSLIVFSEEINMIFCRDILFDLSSSHLQSMWVGIPSTTSS